MIYILGLRTKDSGFTICNFAFRFHDLGFRV